MPVGISQFQCSLAEALYGNFVKTGTLIDEDGVSQVFGDSVPTYGHFHECFMKEFGMESTTFTSLQ